ncbi:hypothetical protein BKA62DRAFT_787181, partial [Auriculariales sp. MPI-PUGE-AT-0066]
SLNRLPAAAAKLVPNLSVLTNSPGTLFKTLSRLPRNGVGSKLMEARWAQKNFTDCYWLVTRTRLKVDGAHGKAYGRLFWRGREVEIQQMPNKPPVTEVIIRGGLKRNWRVFAEEDMANPPKYVQQQSRPAESA